MDDNKVRMIKYVKELNELKGFGVKFVYYNQLAKQLGYKPEVVIEDFENNFKITNSLKSHYVTQLLENLDYISDYSSMNINDIPKA